MWDAQRETTAEAVAKNKINTIDITLTTNRPLNQRQRSAGAAVVAAAAAIVGAETTPPLPTTRYSV